VETMSAKAAARRIAKGARSYLMLVQSELISESSASAETLPPDTDIIPEATLQGLLDEYKDVFEELKGLPPNREVGHTIPLVEGAVPPAKRSYRLTHLGLPCVKQNHDQAAVSYAKHY